MANPALSGFAKPLPTWWFKRVPTRQSQVSESIPREICDGMGQPGIPGEAPRAGGSGRGSRRDDC